ncbi:MAG: site-specific DNA-methyltransferase [Thermoprotei archaeon]
MEGVGLPINRIITGNCIEVMKQLPDESVDMVMFSPPYYGLRDYGKSTETVWGGDGNCDHEWAEHVKPKERGSHGKSSWHRPGRDKEAKWYPQISNFCVKCDAYKGQLGLEPTWELYVEHLVEVCREVKRILKKSGSMYIVLGDTYAGSNCGRGDRTLFQNYRRVKVAGDLYEKPTPQAKAAGYKPKSLIGIPWRVAFALIDDGWILRNDIIWYKPNAMPSSVKDRLTQTYEHIFFFVKNGRYYYDLDAVRIPLKTTYTRFNLRVRDVKRGKGGVSAFGVLKASEKEVENYVYPERKGDGHPLGKNPGDFWSAKTKPFKGAHFAVYPEEICVRPILASCPPGGVVLDPFCGSGTTLVVAKRLGRNYIGIEMNPEYVEIAMRRLGDTPYMTPLEKYFS